MYESTLQYYQFSYTISQVTFLFPKGRIGEAVWLQYTPLARNYYEYYLVLQEHCAAEYDNALFYSQHTHHVGITPISRMKTLSFTDVNKLDQTQTFPKQVPLFFLQCCDIASVCVCFIFKVKLSVRSPEMANSTVFCLFVFFISSIITTRQTP